MYKKENLLRSIANSSLNQPYIYGMGKAASFFTSNSIHIEEMLKVADQVNVEEVNAFISLFKQSWKVVSLIQGNVTQEEALHLANEMVQILKQEDKSQVEFVVPIKSSPVLYSPLASLPETRIVELKPHSSYYWKLRVPNEADENSCLIVYYQ